MMSDTPQTEGEAFDGLANEADHATMERARARIEEVRKADVTVRFLDEAGRPLAGTAEIHMTRHAFPFGAALSHTHRLAPGDEGYAGKQAGLEAAADLFTMATVNCHWGLVQPTREGPPDWSWTDLFLEWAEAHGMRSRMHALLYINRSYTPPWHAQVATTEDWWPLIHERVAAVAERYGQRIHEYDVINEMFVQHRWWEENAPGFPDLSAPENALRVFEIARKHLPDATLIPLESFIPTLYPDNTVMRNYYAYCQRLLELGTPLDAIGYQGHFYTDKPSFLDGTAAAGPKAFCMSAIEEGLNHLASLGKPIHITEFNPPSRNAREPSWPARLSDEAVAAWTVNYYTLAFSKPYIRELVRWFVVDTVGGRGVDAGLVTRDGEKKPAYWALKELLQETWCTRWAGTLADGTCRFRGFLGAYQATVPGYRPASFELCGDGKPVDLRLTRL